MALFGRKKRAPERVEESVDEPDTSLPGTPETDSAGLRPMAAHQEYLLSFVEPLPEFGMQLLDAVGLPLCENLEAYQDIPGVDVALVDGYAVRAGDVALASPGNPVTLPVAGRIGIGQQATGEVVPGACVELISGAPMPRGTDALVPAEHARPADDGDEVEITLGVQPGQFVRERGSDISEGDVLLRAGDNLDPRIVGMLAGAGIDRVMARPRPRVVVLATGAELVEPGLALGAESDIYDANSYMLAAAARAEGAQVFRVGLYTKDPDEIRDAINDQLIRADLIISTGGVSRDDYDLVKSVMPELGLTDFCDVAMVPGQSQGFGLIGPERVPMIMLPGNPISAYVSYQAFVRPTIRKLMGQRSYVSEPQRAITRSLIRSVPGKTQLVRGRVEQERGGRRMVEPFVSQISHQLGDLAQANCLVVIDEETEMVPAGAPVRVWMFEE